MSFQNCIRNFEILQRWGIVRMHQRGTVGGHSHRVVIYSDQIADVLGIAKNDPVRSEIMRYAAWHDALELETSDVPSPVKNLILDKSKHDSYEIEYLNNLGVTLSDDPQVTGIVKVADLLDAMLSLVVEKRMGNQLLDAMYEDMNVRLWRAVSALRFGDGLCDDLRKEIVNAIGRHTYMSLQPFPR